MKIVYLWILPFLLLSSGCTTVTEVKKRVKDPKTGFFVDYIEYKPTEKKSTQREVVIFPPTRGVTRIEKSYGKKIAKKGYVAKVLVNWQTQKVDLKSLGIHQIHNQGAVDAFQLVAEGKPKKYSLFGASLGGIHSAVVAPHFKNVDRVFVVASGSPVPEVIAKSTHPSMVKLRKLRSAEKEYGGLDGYAQAIDRVFDLDPGDREGQLKNKKFGMVLLKRDSDVPYRNQLKLKALLKPQKVYSINARHVPGIVRSWLFYQNRIIKFLIGEKKE